MAKSQSKSKARLVYCRDCKFARDFHEKDYKGNFFLCKCDYEEWSQFLNHPHECRFFKDKNF